MRLIDADNLKEDIRWSEVARLSIEEIIKIINDSLTIARTDKPLAIINDKVIYMTDGHVNALLEYEKEQATREACERIMHEFNEVQKWENDNGKK